ncbi:indole-3-glycerol phosphate synthase TrpC [Campylobacter geochelonis]|uniref:Indole-3-glycerol phosphate synthase n=1 Tax=Campylobacter geochelonis TaxID=1780362 RepID=A0A128EHT9_9BACT|nr:indole-3-glycerol phosphate synthase TrpC [Campylobacter geochelonis]QKF71433.1 indole-3-glycerol phosphate synthase [Campylobacter geochelonis]CZE47823.1 indole-3-glycerol-phosphate synthase [Campylobacter geochelonis]CZE48354.1 indole-3-glycerol-phosphate synthase [Campylobacter geochelonis]CZE50859.1 indole-3-glycerol-phosphate synthase [Campylobacter geochelonis]
MILDKIIEKTKEDLEKKKKLIPFDTLGRSLSSNPYMPRDVFSVLKTSENDPYKIIAEVKKASPSKGVIREDFDPVSIAVSYEKGGANAFSVLSEPHFFQGSLEYISLIRRYTKSPILRKDFIVDKYQILEAAVYGADFVLLIAKALSQKELKELLEYARYFGLEALVETHDKEDVKKAIFAGANIIGINHRDLQTFDMHMDLCEKLIPIIPNGKIIVAESGLYEHEQLVNLNKFGVDAFLIGESFMRQDDVEMAVKKIKGA